MIRVDITDEQEALTIDVARLRQAVERIMCDAGVANGSVSVAVVDDPAIHELNRQFLEHDYPTDVLSFLLEREGDHLEGEVIVSSDTAVRMSTKYDWPPGDELLLYVIHGTLHLVGYDDLQPELLEAMRAAEQRCLAWFGLAPRYTSVDDSPEP